MPRTKELVFESTSSRLLVTFPLGDPSRRVHAKPIAGGGLWLHTFEVDATGSRKPGTFSYDVLPQEDGTFLITDASRSLDMALMENAMEDGRALKILRGWLRVRPGGPKDLHMVPKGRWIQVAMAKANASTWVRPKPLPWWKHRPYTWPNRQIKGKTWQVLNRCSAAADLTCTEPVRCQLRSWIATLTL